jgi:hypothetical protein
MQTTYLENCPPHSIGSTSSGVAVEWNHTLEGGLIDRALFVFTEVATGNQTLYEFAPGIRLCLGLIAGTYKVAVFAKGLEIYRSSLDLQPGVVTPFKPVLGPSTQGTTTINDILGKFDINEKIATRDLNVAKNSTLVLDSQDSQFKTDWRTLEIKDVDVAKRIIGNSDNLWAGGLPRFQSTIPALQMTPEQVAVQSAREYVYGNSAVVKDWAKVINDNIFSQVWRFPLFLFDTVTINAGGVLVVGDRGNFFVCERLRMHVTATLLIKGSGPIHVEPASFNTFC